MKLRIGLKSFTAMAVFIACLFFMKLSDSISLYYFSQLESKVIFFNTIIAMIASFCFFSYWRLEKKSNLYIQFNSRSDNQKTSLQLLKVKSFNVFLGENIKWKAWELPHSFIIGVYFICFFTISIITVNNRGLKLIENYSQKLSAFDTKFCEEKEVDLKKKKVKYGCELVQRAFEMGYAKTLGDCADEEIDPRDLETCTNRRFDEPWLHFAYRRVSRAFNDNKNNGKKSSYEKFKDQLNKKTITDLLSYQKFSLLSLPRSSHHVFTNLAYPGTKFQKFWLENFDQNNCLIENKQRSFNASIDKNKSNVFEHVIQNLLFSTKIKDKAGYCREFNIHWGQSMNVCRELSKDTQGVLDRVGGMKHVSALINRFKNLKEVESLKAGVKSEKYINHFLSFSCLIEDREMKNFKLKQFPINVLGEKIKARELRTSELLAENLEKDLYLRISKLLKRNFNYTKFDSHTSSEIALKKEEVKEKFNDNNFFFSKINYLNSFDIFLGEDIGEFSEVYPQHIHLKNYIERFRNFKSNLQRRL